MITSSNFKEPLVRLLAPVAAAIRFPDLRAVFPHLRNPEEAAFIAIVKNQILSMKGMPILAQPPTAAPAPTFSELTLANLDARLRKLEASFAASNFP